MNEETEKKNELEEGHLYVLKNGELQEIISDPDDTMRKIRISEEAMNSVKIVQKSIRKYLGGYKPDLTFIASALLIESSKNEELSKKAIQKYYQAVLDKLA